MLEAKGDIWDHWERGHVVAVTTNGLWDRLGNAIMGAGIAKQAKERFPELPGMLAQKLQSGGNLLYYFPSIRVVTFPTKEDWREDSIPALIAASARRLTRLLDSGLIEPEHLPLYAPPFGAGNGNLDWEKQVKPLVDPILDDRVVVLV